MKFRCKLCNDIFEGFVVRHQMYWCKCGKSGVDLEEHYARTIGEVEWDVKDV